MRRTKQNIETLTLRCDITGKYFKKAFTLKPGETSFAIKWRANNWYKNLDERDKQQIADTIEARSSNIERILNGVVNHVFGYTQADIIMIGIRHCHMLGINDPEQVMVNLNEKIMIGGLEYVLSTSVIVEGEPNTDDHKTFNSIFQKLNIKPSTKIFKMKR